MSDNPSKLVNINANQSELVLQNKANVTLKINVVGHDRKLIQKELKEKASEAFKILKKQKEISTHTVQQSIGDKYEQEGSKMVKRGLEGSFIIGLISYDFDAVNKAVESVEDIAQVASINTSISAALLKEKEAGLTKLAIVAFKEKSVLVSEAFGFKSYHINEVSVSSTQDESHSNYRGFSNAMGGSMASASFSTNNQEEEIYFIEPRQERLSVTVSGSIKLATSFD